FCFVSLVAILAVGCGSSSDCGPTDPRICGANRAAAGQMAGNWREVGAPGGTGFFVTLGAHGTSLVGGGSYTTTTGTSGAVDVRGFVFWRDSFFAPSGYEIPATSNVVLDFTFANRSAHLNQGSLSGDTLTGVITFSEDPFTAYL